MKDTQHMFTGDTVVYGSYRNHVDWDQHEVTTAQTYLFPYTVS